MDLFKDRENSNIIDELRNYIEGDMSYLSERTEYARGYKGGIRVVRDIIDGIIKNNTEVRIEENEFIYKGIRIDKMSWESASCPMYCGNISDDDMRKIVKELYWTLVDTYDREVIAKYVNNENERYERFDEIDDFRWVEEENLFLDYGGKYYEDMTDEEYAEVCGLNNNTNK